MYKLNNNGWPSRLSDGAFVNPENNQDYLDWLAAGNTPEPADPVPNPRIAQIKVELDEIDRKSIRALRENDTARIAAWETQAAALRVELVGLS